MKEQKIAVIGFGMWGKNIVRNFYNLNVLDIVCDLDEEAHKVIQEQFPGVKVTKDFNDIINDSSITGVAVVTPSHTHFKIVKAMLEAGKNVYVEKPISTVAEEARVLTELAEEKGLVCSTTHSLGTKPGTSTNSIDHILFTGNATPLYYTTIVDDVTVEVSDHTPIYCDFKLN
jgi:UDP-2-acetamido-3-amino-2,3-dideoxy-glucuronate N-acetyltransferase